VLGRLSSHRKFPPALMKMFTIIGL
jgi:hypothetical protein